MAPAVEVRNRFEYRILVSRRRCCSWSYTLLVLAPNEVRATHEVASGRTFTRVGAFSTAYRIIRDRRRRNARWPHPPAR